jgi:hypothetical protein
MDAPAPNTADEIGNSGPAHAVLAQVRVAWGPKGLGVTAVVLHAARDMLVLEADSPGQALPPLGTPVVVSGEVVGEHCDGRLAEHGRNGRFLVSIGERPVRRALRLKVSLPGSLHSPSLTGSVLVEIVDLTTGGARVRGVELPVGSQVTLAFTPPGRLEPVTVRALVAHGTHGAERPWIGVAFRLVALRGGR